MPHKHDTIRVLAENIKPGDIIFWSESMIEFIVSVTHHRHNGLITGQITFIVIIYYVDSANHFEKVSRSYGSALHPRAHFRSQEHT